MDAAERAAAPQDNDSQLYALVEAVWWTSAANEYLRALHGFAYECLRDRSDAGRMVKGMWCVRSASMHDPYGVTSITEIGDAYADTYTNLYGVFWWRPLHEIDSLNDRADHGFGREAYVESLADGPRVIDTVRQAIQWLHHPPTQDLPGA